MVIRKIPRRVDPKIQYTNMNMWGVGASLIGFIFKIITPIFILLCLIGLMKKFDSRPATKGKLTCGTMNWEQQSKLSSSNWLQ